MLSCHLFSRNCFPGVISTLMSVYLPVAVKDLLGDKDADELNNISAYINAVFIFGGAFGGFISGIISDNSRQKNCSYFFNCLLRFVYDSYRLYAYMVGCCDLHVFKWLWIGRYTGYGSYHHVRRMATKNKSYFYWHFIYRYTRWYFSAGCYQLFLFRPGEKVFWLVLFLSPLHSSQFFY